MNMDKINNRGIRDSWNGWSDDYYAREYRNADTVRLLMADPPRAFPPTVWHSIHAWFPDLAGVRVCVPSSGDNKAAFAFHLLGAKVTTCDISSEQLKNAGAIADENGWAIRFHECDSMIMDGVASDAFDLVYTSNGVHTWISDLPVMHNQFHRILRGGGRYIFFETHPFNRPFDDSTDELRMKKPYADTSNDDWRVQDFVNSLIESRFEIVRMEEFYADRETFGANWWNLSEWNEKADWRVNPYAALPQWMMFSCLKNA
jgi:SAM-dependent methyltransferase